jgi:hypothetical protein
VSCCRDTPAQRKSKQHLRVYPAITRSAAFTSPIPRCLSHGCEGGKQTARPRSRWSSQAVMTMFATFQAMPLTNADA